MSLTGSCHCGAVKFKTDSPLNEAITCNCSICYRKGTILAFAPASQVQVEGFEKLTGYKFGPKKITHYFCSICGVTTFGAAKGPDGQEMKALNLRCLPDLDLSHVKVTAYDGKSI